MKDRVELKIVAKAVSETGINFDLLAVENFPYFFIDMKQLATSIKIRGEELNRDMAALRKSLDYFQRKCYNAKVFENDEWRNIIVVKVEDVTKFLQDESIAMLGNLLPEKFYLYRQKFLFEHYGGDYE